MLSSAAWLSSIDTPLSSKTTLLSSTAFLSSMSCHLIRRRHRGVIPMPPEIKRRSILPASAHASGKVRSYIAARPPRVRRALRDFRRIVRSVVPNAVEHFSYGIPAFLLEGRRLVWYAAHTHHCSLYPIKSTIQRANASALQGYEMSKGTVRFSHEKPIPARLIARLVRARVAEVRAASKK